jgi:hypothetical protein
MICTSKAGKAIEIAPQAHHWKVLPGADFGDSFRIRLKPALASQEIGELAASMMKNKAPWIDALLNLRNLLVRPFGLKRAKLGIGSPVAAEAGKTEAGLPGFPVLAQDQHSLLMGLDDQHLDFRVCIEKSRDDAGPDHEQWLTVTTLVRTRRLFGKAYLATIMPFHRRIVGNMLERMSR